MSVQVPMGGQENTIPNTGDTGWGDNLTTFFQLLGQYVFQNPADLSNNTLALRQYLYTSTTNAATRFTVAPNGISAVAAAEFYSDSALLNGSSLLMGTDGATHAYVTSSTIGTGLLLPLDLTVNNVGIRITNSGRVLINTLIDDGVNNVQINGTLKATTIIGGLAATNLAGGVAGSLVYQTAPNTTGFLAPGANGNILSTTGSSIAWIAPPSGINTNYVSARSYVGTGPYTGVGGVDHGGVMLNGSNIVTIPPGPFAFTSGMVGKTIYVGGSGGTNFYTIASFVSATKVTTTTNATATTTLATVVVMGSSQDDTANLNTFFAAAGGSQAQAYAPGGVYVVDFTALNPIPPGVQGIFGDGLNATFFISKTRANSVHAGGFVINGAPSNFTLGGAGKGFSLIGPGLYASQQLLCSSLSITNGVLSAVVSNGNTATIGQTYKITGARGTASPYNDTYWTITSSSSTGFSGTPVYWDMNPALGNITSVTVDGSANLTVLDSNPNRKVGYVVNFSGLTTATFLNGNNYTVSAVNYTTPGDQSSAVVGYTFANTGLAPYSIASDSGIARYLADVTTVTDNFVSFPNWDGIRVISNNFPGGTNIATHLHMNDLVVSGFGGAGIRVMTPNFGSSGTLTCNSNCEGLAFESAHATSGFFTNPSCYSLTGGCEFESNTFVGLYIRNFGGGTIEMPGIGGSGIAVLLYNCSGTTMNGGDLEVQTPWASNTTLYPGHSIELRGSTGVRINPCYISFNNSAGQIGCYMWNSSVSCVYERSRHFLAGGNVQPTNEVYIEGTCIGCAIIEPELIGLNTTAWTVNGTSNSIILKNVMMNSNSTNITTFMSLQNAGSISVGAVQAPHVIFLNTTNSQIWQVGYNATAGTAGFFDNTANSWAMQIADTTHATTFLSTTASTGTASGAIVVKGGAGIAGNLFVGGTITNTTGNVTFNNTGANEILTLTGTVGAQLGLSSSINGQRYNVAYNEANSAFDIFDAITSVNVMSIADTTNITTFNRAIVVVGNISGTNAIVVNGTSNPQFQIVDSTSTQTWTISHNTINGVLSFFDTTGSHQRMTIADGTGVVTMTANVASTSATTGTLVVTGGAGVSGNLNVGANAAVTGTLAVTGVATFTAAPVAPTAAVNTSTTQIATTAFANPSATLGATAGSNALPSGLTLKYGVGNTTTTSYSFPAAYGSACVGVWVQVVLGGFTAGVVSFSTSGFTISNATIGVGQAFTWFALGY